MTCHILYNTYSEERARFHALHSEPQLIVYFSMDYDTTQILSYRGLYIEISNKDNQRLRKNSKFLKLLKAIAFENKTSQSRGKRVEKSILELIHTFDIELNS